MQPRHVDRYVPAVTNGGWGFAAGIIALAILLIVAATVIHKKTYKHPTDPTASAIGDPLPERPPR